MLTSKARRRLALKTSALVTGAAAVVIGVPAVAQTVAPKPVTYTCKTDTAGTGTDYRFQMDLQGPLTAPSPSSTAVVTWNIGQPTSPGPSFTVRSPIPTTDRVVIQATVIVTGTPNPTPTETRGVTATATPFSPVTASATMPVPQVLISLTPKATGVMAVVPDDFVLQVGPSGAAGSTWYTCSVKAGSESEASAAAALVTVATGVPTGTSTGTPSSTPTTPTPTATPTPTKTTPTPKKTRTSYVTVVETPTKRSSKTPKAGANTGAGGEMGPDGRMFVLVGSALILAAGVGGLAMRRRGVNRS
ncbi:hypothetical protein [Nonomuraea roseoviolacea]|uniref:Gram-positive cocci surface proteins LPxTG domain-containing protein n=1 Tax=Nonomuraea roseoviolacea subsp. carminata TaxID=160689 RepID=A0ABT1JWZ2_9ACTN|nr:hypothetical protein [Nonomuraea roseoviolacea]MCP2346277.1 hypothetical protein [Nonomuraea roseoviolacea subsp. carminata]